MSVRVMPLTVSLVSTLPALDAPLRRWVQLYWYQVLPQLAAPVTTTVMIASLQFNGTAASHSL